MKRRLAVLILLFSVSSCVAPLWGEYETCKEINNTTENISIATVEVKEREIVGSENIDESTEFLPMTDGGEGKEEQERELYIKEATDKIAVLDASDKMQWFIEYKAIQEEYSEWIDVDETIYDYFTEEELQLLFRVVEAEVTGEEHFQSKANVASVIFNRLFSEEFGNDLTEILTQKAQFSSYHDGRYMRVVVTETTILACEYAFQIEDSTNGALYFDSCNGNSWASGAREYVFTDSVNHAFYR